MASIKPSILLALLLFTCAQYAWPQEIRPIRIGVVTYLSGPGAGPMGLPGRNAAELTFDALNAGTVPAPYQSGETDYDQGITRAGNAHVRRVIVQLAWGWIRHQPDSALTYLSY